MQTLALIDVAGVFRAQWAASEGQTVGSAYSQTLKRVAELRSRYDHCAICLDSPPYRRSKISPDYKGQREKPAENMLGQYSRVKQALADQGLAVFASPGYEADDIIATLVSQAVQLPEDKRLAVTVISSDKDLLQLVDDAANVTAHSFQTGVSFNAEGVRGKFGVAPAGMLDFLALTGDKSDNVPGVRGVGDKTAALVVNSKPGLDGALVGEFIAGLTPRLADAIADAAEDVRLARRLIALETDAPVDLAEVFVRREPKAKEGQKPVDLDGAAEDPGIADAEWTDAQPLPDEVKPEKPVATVTPINAAAEKTTAPARAPVTAAATAKPAPSAIVRVEPSFDMALEPRNNTAAHEMAKVICQSGLYPRLLTAEAVYVVILRGRELGLTVGASLDNLSFFEGKVCMSAHLIIDRAKRHPDCEYFRFVGGNDTYAEYVTKRRDEPEETPLRYTIEQAKRAGICPETIRTARPPYPAKDDRGSWEKRTGEMLRKTCGVQLARICYPGASQGLYAAEELDAA